MAFIIQSHGGGSKERYGQEAPLEEALAPAPGDIAADEAADFGYWLPPSGSPNPYLPGGSQTLSDLDQLGALMVDSPPNDVDATSDSTMPPVMTYWGQFLDHELTARTDRDGQISKIDPADPPADPQMIETKLKNARTPRFDLDSVYGGVPLGTDFPQEAVHVAFALRHPSFPDKMRVGTAADIGNLPDGLDEHRDLPRFRQVDQATRDAMVALAATNISDPAELQGFIDKLPRRALIGDMRNDENIIVAQFHLSFLRFHNRAVDFLEANNTGWTADFHSAQILTRLHYQWLAVEKYLKTVCDPSVVDAVIADRASHFFEFRADYDNRHTGPRLGNTLPLEFSAAAFRFGHSMVRNKYDYNNTFGRPAGEAPFDQIFAFTGDGGFFGVGDGDRIPRNWVIDWARFLGIDPKDSSDGKPGRFARKIDTLLAPPLGAMFSAANDVTDPTLQALLKHLARRNLRRGYNLRLSTGQALHKHLKDKGAVNSGAIADVSTLPGMRQEISDFLKNSSSELHKKTPLWFYILAEAEAAGGNKLGELGSFIVASTFIGVMLADPDSALTKGFEPAHSPLRMPDGSAIDTLEKWMRFALVLE